MGFSWIAWRDVGSTIRQLQIIKRFSLQIPNWVSQVEISTHPILNNCYLVAHFIGGTRILSFFGGLGLVVVAFSLWRVSMLGIYVEQNLMINMKPMTR